MSSRADNKPASQLVSLTMRLKGKLHPQRIKRAEQIKQSLTNRTEPADLNQQDKSECVLADQQRAVISSLHYFKALVDKLGVDRPGVDKLVQDQSVVRHLLVGASSGVLEAAQTLVELQPHLSKTTCPARLYQSLAQLIRWTDQVVIQGVAHNDKESEASVTTVIRSVLDGVKDVARFAAERQEGAAPLSPVRSPSAASTKEVGSPQTTWRTFTAPPGHDEWETIEGAKEEQAVLTPPKPPIPLILAASPPALPPKKRSSLGPASCRVAIVTPMRREPEAKQQVQQESEDGDCPKRFSSSSADSTHFEDDPDYDFLHKDLSSSETLPPLPTPFFLPPALPEKRCRSTTGATNSQTPTTLECDSTHKEESPAPCNDIIDPDEALSSKAPPPLPEKKHIHQYLQVCSSYRAKSAAMFYQRPPNFSQCYNSKQQETHTPLNTPETPPDNTITPSPELPPAPLLPPKKKKQVLAKDEKQTNENQSRDSSQSLQQEEQEEREEVLLTNQQEILNRVTVKSEDEDGPDVKAASAEILLVYAAESSGNAELDSFREAFLSTYRGFISPKDVISKLQRRYRHMCEGCEPPDPKPGRNTLQLLLRVVDELCVIELDSDLLLLLLELVYSLLSGGELDLANLLHCSILSKMEQKWHLIGSPRGRRPLAERSVAARPGTLLDFRSQDLAEQLTLLDSELFYKIELPEVLLWSKEQNEEKSPNLKEFTQHFNNVSFWVRSVIILQDKPQDREKLLLKFLKIMKHLRKLNNFNSYLSILSALDSAPLRRLDWQKNTTEALEEYGSLIDSSSSFRAYRAALAEAEPPCIPYLGLILQDLTFVHLGNPDTLMTSQGSKVNFSKRWQQFNIIDSLRRYKKTPYSLQPNDDIISFFNDFNDHLAQEALWELSLRLRPRNAPRANQR